MTKDLSTAGIMIFVLVTFAVFKNGHYGRIVFVKYIHLVPNSKQGGYIYMYM